MTDRPPAPDEATSGLVRKTGVAVAGGAVTAAGVVMLVTPGPGIITIALGLGILSSEFEAPRRVLTRIRNRGQ
ncbi:MAG: PGPGW domain-containing protein [Acidimicrobiia bacterium]|nr:PGPGW domain-containing protein [Acidimicrobiia bacterium]